MLVFLTILLVIVLVILIMSLNGYNDLIKIKKQFNKETLKLISLLRLRNRKIKELLTEIKKEKSTQFTNSLEEVVSDLYNKEKKILIKDQLVKKEIELEQNIIFGNLRHYMLIQLENLTNQNISKEFIEQTTKEIEEMTKELQTQKDIFNKKVDDYHRVIDNFTGRMAISLNQRLQSKYIKLQIIDKKENQEKILNMFKL